MDRGNVSGESERVSRGDRLARRSEQLLQLTCRSPRAALVRVRGQWTFFAERAPGTGEPKRSDLLASLKQHPAVQLLPQSFRFVERLPSTPDGAVNREMLSNGWECDPCRDQEPRGVTEQLLSAIWSKLCRDLPIGREDQFFARGADETDAAQLAEHIYDVFRVTLTSQELFEHSALHAQARLIERRMVLA